MNFAITKSNQDHPYLQWGFIGDESNIDHYNIFKKSNSQGYLLFDQTQNKYYEDITETIYYGGQQGHHWIYYYVTAVTTSDYESNASDRKSVDVNGYANEQKISTGKEPKKQLEYSLSSNYPNPFNPSTSINYTIKSAGVVTLKVYDMLGKEVATLVNERKEPGSYLVNFNAENLPSGIYVYKITANDFTSTKKLMLLK
jgi:Secretion system C-terminal sorting domain